MDTENPQTDMADSTTAKSLAVKKRGLDTAKQLAALTLYRAENSFSAIATALGVDRGTVTRFLKDVVSSEDARKLLELKRPQAIEGWGVAIVEGAKKGDHRPARDLLVATDVIEEKKGPGSNIAIIVGDGTRPLIDVNTIPTISVQAVETKALTEDQ